MRTLLVGYKARDLFAKGRHGRLATDSALLASGCEIVCHTLDIYDRHAIEREHHLKAVCSAHLPPGPWDFVKFRTGPKTMSGELALDLLQEIHLLKPARFELDFQGCERDRNSLLSKIRDNPERVRDFTARWTASLPGTGPVEFASVPGCFCHRRRDEGGLALAETVAKSIAAKGDGGIRLLDMGCGCGLVGLLVAKAVPGVSLTLVDSHARAVEAARMNAAALGIDAEVILADCGTPARMDGTFDVFAGNPPYYSDYRIADVFLETAKRALRPGGECWTVCKNAAGLEPVQRRHFGETEVSRRRGYAVLRSVKTAVGGEGTEK